MEMNGGVAELLESADTKDIFKPICRMLLYEPKKEVIHIAIENNDTLAAVGARLLLWRDPRTLPSPVEQTKGWQIYLDRWRPGKPHRDMWIKNFSLAWLVVRGEELT
jgi:hypothetical protein